LGALPGGAVGPGGLRAGFDSLHGEIAVTTLRGELASLGTGFFRRILAPQRPRQTVGRHRAQPPALGPVPLRGHPLLLVAPHADPAPHIRAVGATTVPDEIAAPRPTREPPSRGPPDRLAVGARSCERRRRHPTRIGAPSSAG